MPLVTLINMDDPMWAFEEAMGHRLLLGGMSPLDRFSALPYFLEFQVGLPMWRLNQQTAQDDAITTLGAVAIPAPQPVMDNRFETPDQRAWFSLTNEMETRIAASLLPRPTLPAW